VFANYTLEFALQLSKKHGKTCQDSRTVPAGFSSRTLLFVISNTMQQGTS